MIDNDLIQAEKRHHQQMLIRQCKTTEDLNILRKIANDRKVWKNLSTLICSVAQISNDIVAIQVRKKERGRDFQAPISPKYYVIYEPPS